MAIVMKGMIHVFSRFNVIRKVQLLAMQGESRLQDNPDFQGGDATRVQCSAALSSSWLSLRRRQVNLEGPAVSSEETGSLGAAS